MRRKRPPQHPDELFDKRQPVESPAPDMDDEENVKAVHTADSSSGIPGSRAVIGSPEWRNHAKRNAGRPKRYR